MTSPGLLFLAVALVRASRFGLSTSRVLFIVGGVLAVVHLRAGAAVLVAACLAFLVAVPANHPWFGLWVFLTFLIFTDTAQQRLVVRWQLAILYGFTGINKISGPWLGGDHLRDLFLTGHGIVLPVGLSVAMAWTVMLSESLLAPTLWVRRMRPLVLLVGGVLHLSIWLSLGPPLVTAPALLFFNGLAFGLLVWSTAQDDTTSAEAPAGDVSARAA